jgi:hypothetical protein
MATAVKSFDLIGKKEAVSDFISLITPSDTPFLSSLKTEKITNTLYSWMEDQLRAEADNAKIEGADATDSDRDQPSMKENRVQILEETFKVSGTAEAVKTYGREGAVARETMKTGKLLKMDLEFALVGRDQATAVAHAGATAGRFKNVRNMIHADTKTAMTQAADDAGVASKITEAAIMGTHEKLYNAGSDAGTLQVKPSVTKDIAAFSQASTRTQNIDVSDKKITNVINVYESPFGTVRIVKNRRLYDPAAAAGAKAGSDAILYDASNWKLMVLRDWFREKLARTGDADRWQVIGEFGLKHINEKASALITGINGYT